MAAMDQHLFAPGNVYRRRDLHQRFGGQRQGGISTPANKPFLFLFTGDSGEHHGYKDGWSDDGLFLYTGEGQRGDMKFVAGNGAIRDHSKNGKDLYVFEQVKKNGKKGFVRYLGQMVCTGHQFRDAPDTDGSPRKAIVFELSPIDLFEEVPGREKNSLDLAEEDEFAKSTLEDLRSKAIADSAEGRTPIERKANWRRRSRAIRAYVLKRAGDNCEGCHAPAPFKTPVGQPYLEPHHIRRLTDGGPDHPESVIGVCPNCHRRAHYAADADAYNQQLAAIVSQIEAR